MNKCMRCWALALVVSWLAIPYTASGGVTGRVFAIIGQDQAGLPGVVVSDGFQVVTTDADGQFSLEPHPQAAFVFISLPSGFVPVRGWYRALGRDIDFDFPLRPVANTSPLVFVQLSDVHFAFNAEEFSQAFIDRTMIVPPQPVLDALIAEINTLSPDFIILTGDIVADATRPPVGLVTTWMKYIANEIAPRLGAPFFTCVGNHDIRVRDRVAAKRLYEQHFGPTYYSFNVKGVHFIVLDPYMIIEGRLVRSFSAEQVAWLARNLEHVPPNVPVVVFCHEPTSDWAPTPETAAVLTLVEEASITALITGHWHSNLVLRSYPYLEITSGAVSGSWWEGEAPDGSWFGYRVFRMARGQLTSIWREIDRTTVDIASPSRAVVTWHDHLQAAVWGQAQYAEWRIDDGPTFPALVTFNGLWTTAHGNLNFSIVPTGFHTLSVKFVMADGSFVSASRRLYVVNPELTLRDMRAHEDVFAGRLVAIPRLEVQAVGVRFVSATDGTDTIILKDLPFPVARGDWIGIMGLYRLHHPILIRPYDLVFFTKY